MKKKNPYRAAGTFSGASYVERSADENLIKEIIDNRRVPYFLAPRQSGKSSLISNVIRRLRQDHFQCVFVDISTYSPSSLTSFDAFLKTFTSRITSSLDLASEIPFTGDLSLFAEALVADQDRNIVVFIDEIDRLIGLEFKDSFLASLRGLFNQRTANPKLEKLQFVLAGTVRPNELIASGNGSPFNVGEPIQLKDMNLPEVAQLTSYLWDDPQSRSTEVEQQIFEAANGSVYLSQLILEQLWQRKIQSPNSTIGPEDVKHVVEAIIQGSPQNLHFINIRSAVSKESEVAQAFRRYCDDKIIDQPMLDALVMAGIADAHRPYRNPIYERVFGPRGPLSLSSDPRVSVARLPNTGSELFGRRSELQLLDEAWDNPNTNVVVFSAWGGVGKTALVNHWLRRHMARDNYRGAECVYGWSFYSQGASERATSADLFIDQALRWFGDEDPTAGSPWDKGERLANYIRKSRTLLILDGLEPLQYPPGPQEGRLKDAAMQALLVELAGQQPGLCVISTRERVADLIEFENKVVIRHDLEQLSPQAGAEVLRSLNVRGDDEELEQASKELGGHAFSLTLLGSYLDEVLEGEIRRRNEIENLFEDTRYGEKAQATIAAYEKWLGEGIELSILRLLGFFDRPADAPSIAALCQAPVIPRLTDPLQHFKAREWNQAVAKLRRIKLLAEASPSDPGMLDAHPLLREHFKQQLRSGRREAWREGNRRLYEHLMHSAKEFPETTEEMSPLYEAVTHGCAAGEYVDSFNQVYWRRIQRGRERFNWNELGAFGADLGSLSSFFEVPWTEPVAVFHESYRAMVLSQAGFCLRALGRLHEATQPMRAGFKMHVSSNEWREASTDAGNLSELYLTIGDVRQALEFAQQSLELADKTDDPFRRVASEATLADVLHQMGETEKAASALRNVEELQRHVQPHPFLYSLRGFRYCDLLLDEGRIDEVIERASRTLAIATSQNWLLDIALDNLSLGRAWLLEAPRLETGDTTRAADFLERSVEGLRQAGQMDDLPRGLLARAALHRIRADYERAERDLAEVFRIATRSGMGLHLADYHLESARLRLAQGDTEKARKHTATGKEMIERMGYHRRDKEVTELEEQQTG